MHRTGKRKSAEKVQKPCEAVKATDNGVSMSESPGSFPRAHKKAPLSVSVPHKSQEPGIRGLHYSVTPGPTFLGFNPPPPKNHTYYYIVVLIVLSVGKPGRVLTKFSSRFKYLDD